MSQVHAINLLGAVCLLIWFYLMFARGSFWRVRSRKALPSASKRVVAIVPARNEAGVIGRAVRSLVAQADVDMKVIVIDDNSTDATAEVASAAGNVTVISGKALPSGWSGKVWAVQQGIEAAKDEQSDFLLLTDADIEHSPASIASLVAIAEEGKFDLASYMVKLHCASIHERMLIPAFVYFFFQLYPPEWISEPRRKTAGAAGGCILIRPEALERAGAMQSIRGEIIDDCALAREVKRTGGRIWLGLTDLSASIRPYGSLGEIERMIARTAFNQLRHSSFLLATAILGLLLTYIVPIVLLAGAAKWLGAIACLLMIGSYWPMVRFYRLNPLWALTLPLAAIFYMAATLDSAIRYWIGRGGEWKGRVQDRAGAAHE
jgi:hopene-associated glycosyltransferase HpnB